MYDVIVIGKGPAGMSCAIYLKRAGLNVLVIGKDLGALKNSDKIQNYYGFEEPVSGIELVERGIKQGLNLGIEIKSEEVIAIGKPNNFVVKTQLSKYESKYLVIATGKNRLEPKTKGFEKYKGCGISFCAVCDGFFFRGKRLAVIGSSVYAKSEAEELLKFTNDITIFTDGEEPAANFDGFKVVTEKITEYNGTDVINSIKTETSSYDIDGVFVALGTAGASDFAAKIGAEMQGNNIKVDNTFKTSVENLYAIGDCIGGFLQISKAVADGAVCASEIIKANK